MLLPKVLSCLSFGNVLLEVIFVYCESYSTPKMCTPPRISLSRSVSRKLKAQSLTDLKLFNVFEKILDPTCCMWRNIKTTKNFCLTLGRAGQSNRSLRLFVLQSSTSASGFDSESGQINDFNSGIHSFSACRSALKGQCGKQACKFTCCAVGKGI